MRILHLPESTGRQAFNLSRGESELGHASQVLYRQKNWLNYNADIQLNLQNKSRPTQAYHLAKAFLDLRSKYDIYHFNQGRSLLHFPGKNLFHLDLPLYPKSAKLYVTYQGCDARQKYPTMKMQSVAACHNKGCYQGQCNSGRLDRLRQKSIEKMSQYVEHIWAVNPDLLRFLPKEKSSFLPYAIENETPDMRPESLARRKVTIVHAPTNREAKGSDLIIAAVRRLQDEFPGKIEFILVENTPHAESLKIYQKADLIIDQILIGWYGAFAVETMLMGKPVVARIEPSTLKHVPQKMQDHLKRAIVDAGPANLYGKIKELVTDHELLFRHASESYDYAKEWHDPKRIAQITTEAYSRTSGDRQHGDHGGD